MSTLPDRIAEKILPEPMSGCWLWVACVHPGGYGRATWRGRDYQAHRLVYELIVGPIDDGLFPDHLCRVRSCVNPGHIEIVTNLENFRRGMATGAVALRTGRCFRGHEFTPENTYQYASRPGRRWCRRCTIDRVDARRKKIRLSEHYAGLLP